jgi:hypothetical protein
MDRDEHLAWAKQRAFEYLDAGDLKNACASMMSDLCMHPDFVGGSYDSLNVLGIMYASQHDDAGMRRWIEGFR